jgi:hypothetical protein
MMHDFVPALRIVHVHVFITKSQRLDLRPHPGRSIRKSPRAILENAVSALTSSAVVYKQEDYDSPSTPPVMP